MGQKLAATEQWPYEACRVQCVFQLGAFPSPLKHGLGQRRVFEQEI